MPNWCWTDYVFHGSREDMDIFYKTLMNAKKNAVISDHGFKREWLGNILAEIGCLELVPNEKSWRGEDVKTPDDGKDYSCRGSFDIYESYSFDDPANYLTDNKGNAKLCLSTTTAWAPMPNVWDRVFEKLGLDISYSLIATEEGNFFHVKHNCYPDDPDFDYDYHIDVYGDDSPVREHIRYGKRGRPLHRKGEVIWDKIKVDVRDIDHKLRKLMDGGDPYVKTNEAIDILTELFGVRRERVEDYNDDIEKINKDCSERGTDSYIYVHKFEEYYRVNGFDVVDTLVEEYVQQS